VNRKRPTLCHVAAMLAWAACTNDAPPRAQWQIYLATDAPVPQFGEEVVVEILDGSPSPQERFLDASSRELWPISFGVVPVNPAVPVRVHARFFRLATTGEDGLPASKSIIEATATLPAPSGVTSVSLPLMMKCFGVPADVDAKRSCDPTTGAVAAEPTLTVIANPDALPPPGSWPPAATVDCHGAIPAGMVCVPGGALLLGNPTFPRGQECATNAAAQDPVPEHVVQLSPFALDAFEVTVGAFRELVRTHPDLPQPVPRDADAFNPDGFCTYVGTEDPSNDAMPANCVPWSSANQVCALLGKRLPTEAEWEFAARNRTQETPYAWGTDPDACNYSVVARGDIFEEPTNCESASNGFAVGPVAGGAAEDRTALGIANMGGNVSEWALDLFNSYSARCWNTGNLLIDPTCDVDVNGLTLLHSARGGDWMKVPSSTLGYARLSSAFGAASLGFRCALSR
jgi:formylglycine-generating enzyme required for sulfatase activity